ncbi:tyrosine-protein phosphatase [Butyrivibrio sp. LC3010]|uniref:tyrosine-protein phosphatase n=1 Tax=Butyrivibrio sp. LC3010 TaxID=1280680 RepID=UPI000408CF38|nr:tyrosine-protein phosphatase [Butyrivibrio sp. LC3010]
MGTLLQSTLNTRALPTGNLRYIRSDYPGKLTDQEVKWLLQNDITTVVDLREEKEYLAKPCRLEDEEGFVYYHLPVTGADTPNSPDAVAETYLAMMDEHMDKIIHTIMNADSNVLYFCSAGKDRTGVVSAIILKNLGISDQRIIDDYMETKDNLMGFLTSYVAAHPEVNLNTIVPNEKNIKRVLEILTYREVQKIAKDTIEYIIDEIKPGMPLKEIRFLCEEKMRELGADSFWYYDIGAFVFAGDETTVSVSGREYITSERYIATDDIITIDLSPQVEGTWGDYARTVIVQNGKAVRSYDTIMNAEWRRGVEMEKRLHNRMMEIVRPEMTFEELYYQMNEFIQTEGYINLDFMGNLGHSIVRKKEDRIYIEKGNRTKLADVSLFTFEPHISVSGSKYGYKRENIYYFDKEGLKEL